MVNEIAFNGCISFLCFLSKTETSKHKEAPVVRSMFATVVGANNQVVCSHEHSEVKWIFVAIRLYFKESRKECRGLMFCTKMTRTKMGGDLRSSGCLGMMGGAKFCKAGNLFKVNEFPCNGYVESCGEKSIKMVKTYLTMQGLLSYPRYTLQGTYIRHRIGVDDFILLEDYTNINAFVENLYKRYRENIIYTNIGSVLVSVNPYKQLPIYTIEYLENHSQPRYSWLSPHIYAVANNAYKTLIEEGRPQCILISGESGSGKTEASKYVLKFVTKVTGYEEAMRDISEKLLQTNPLLEAFGNAKTIKNDNSSRFGKYMDIEFDFTGKPVRGKILNYLLEKSRVVQQDPRERNFHIFYQLLAGGEESFLDRLQLKKELESYVYLRNNEVSGIQLSASDAEQLKTIMHAMKTIEISDNEQIEIFNIVASVLHLGNIQFNSENDVSQISDLGPIRSICQLLGCTEEQFIHALTKRTIEARDDIIVTPLNETLSMYARDALAKSLYTRLFSWLVMRLNKSLRPENSSTNAVLGILDIYGFEVIEKNSYEQFCINYCNEKLQELFVELTLKREQEEYLQEGIDWIPVEYFDNKIICELIEEKHKGIISMLNEECLRPGLTTDLSFLEKMDKNLATHKHYISYLKSDSEIQKTMKRDEFRLVHYAGEVIYNVNGFLEKNKDLLFRDLVELMLNTTNSITKSIFTANELRSKKIPDTAINHFKNNINMLMETLMNKDPSYIRCIKPNDFQMADKFDDELVKHQVKYLGLMGNLKVRRAGFAYRRKYDEFLDRYKSLSKKTWPHYDGAPKDGVNIIMKDMGFGDDEYALGKTKVFIRSPRTLFIIEDSYQEKKHYIASIIQKMWKGRQQRRRYLEVRSSIIQVQKYVRGFIERRRIEKMRKAIGTIRRFIEGFITRHGSETALNRNFINIIKARWLINLSKNLPNSVLDKSWPQCPKICEEASAILRDLRMKQLALTYRSGITPEMKKKFKEKVLAEYLFKGRKRLYESSISEWFERDRLRDEQRKLISEFKKKYLTDDDILYLTMVKKYDRHGYRMRDRILCFTQKYIYLLDGKSVKLKHKIMYKDITELVVTTEGDNFLLIRISLELKKDKGDIILSLPYLIEAVTIFIDLIQKPKVLKINNESKILHYLIRGKPGTIKVIAGSTSSIPDICKNKTGELIIMG